MSHTRLNMHRHCRVIQYVALIIGCSSTQCCFLLVAVKSETNRILFLLAKSELDISLKYL